MRKVLAASLVGGIVAATVFVGAPVAAFAADDPIVFPNQPPISNPTPYNPSKNGLRKYMINVTSKMLGKAAPDKWRAEQLANEYVADPTGIWDELDRKTGIDRQSRDYLTNPSSYDDYIIARAETELSGAKAGKPFRAPSTKMAKLGKLVNGVGSGLSMIAGAEVGFQVGKFGSELFGFNVDGGLCAPTFEDAGLIAAITGTDCSDFFDFADDFIPNDDVVGGELIQGQCGLHPLPGFTPAIGVPAPTSEPTCSATYLTNAGVAVTISRFLSAGVNGSNLFEFSIAGGAWTDQDDTRTRTAEGAGYTVYCVDAAGKLAQPTGSQNGATPESGRDRTFILPTVCRTNSFVVFNNVTGSGYEIVYRTGYPIVQPVFSTSDPDRTLVCSIEGTDGKTYTAESAEYTESSGKISSPECPALPDGVAAKNVEVAKQTPGLAPEVVYDEQTNPEYLDWFNSYPECRTGACKLDLVKKPFATLVAPSCFDLGDDCADWFNQPNKADLYQCRYGVHDVGLDECNVYEGVFKPERTQVGAPYSDPTTGIWSGGQSAPGADTSFFGAPMQNPEGSRQCQKGWQAPNPVEWVMQPVNCALERAFAPRPTVLGTHAAASINNWNDTAPGAALGAVTGWGFDLNVTGCNGMGVSLPFLEPVGLADLRIANACSGPLATAATVSRIVLNIVMSIGAALGITRAIGGIVNYGGIA